MRIVIAGLRGEDSIAELCGKEGINQNLTIVGRRIFWRGGQSHPMPRERRALNAVESMPLASPEGGHSLNTVATFSACGTCQIQ